MEEQKSSLDFEKGLAELFKEEKNETVINFAKLAPHPEYPNTKSN